MSVAGILWLLLIGALLLAYVRGGPGGVTAWLKAKFIGTG